MRITVLIILYFLCTNVKAQIDTSNFTSNTKKNRLLLGISLSPAYVKYYLDEKAENYSEKWDEEKKYLTFIPGSGIKGSIFFDWNFFDGFSVKPKLQYYNVNGDINYKNDTMFLNFNIGYSCLDLSLVNISYSQHLNKKLQVFGSFGYNFQLYQFIQEISKSDAFEQDLISKGHLDRVNYNSFSSELGLNYKFKNVSLFASIEYIKNNSEFSFLNDFDAYFGLDYLHYNYFLLFMNIGMKL